MGRHIRTLAIPDGCKSGLAVSFDGTRLVVSGSLLGNMLAVYSWPDGALLAAVRGAGKGRGQFSDPQALCFSPRVPGNIFLAEWGKQRVQVRLSRFSWKLRFFFSRLNA